VLVAILRFVMRHQQKILLSMMEEAHGQYHISSPFIPFLEKPHWTPSSKLGAFDFHSTVTQGEVTAKIREGVVSRQLGKQVKFGDDFYAR
jgi:hypothetical protein